MVNWTSRSLSIENSWQNDGKYDLPVPDETYEARGYIDEMDNLLGLLEEGYELEDEYDYHKENMAELVRGQDPRSIEEPDEEWINQYKMWLFQDEVMQTCLREPSDKNHKVFLIGVCLEYLNKLYDRYEQLGGNIADLD